MLASGHNTIALMETSSESWSATKAREAQVRRTMQVRR
jgi:hypothetical protein